MKTDRSFVLTTDADPSSIRDLRDELAERLPDPFGRDEDVLLLAGLLVRQAQTRRGGYGPVRLRSTVLGQVVNLEVIRDVELDGESGPRCLDAFHGLLEALADSSDRFTVSTFPGSVSLAAQKVVAPAAVHEPEIDLRVAA